MQTALDARCCDLVMPDLERIACDGWSRLEFCAVAHEDVIASLFGNQRALLPDANAHYLEYVDGRQDVQDRFGSSMPRIIPTAGTGISGQGPVERYRV